MSEYEFSETDNRKFLTFSQNLTYLSISLIFSGIIITILGIIQKTNFGDLLIGIIFILIGLSLEVPVLNFQNIIVSTGKDMSELMKAFTFLSWGMIFIMGAIGSILIAVTIGFIINIF